MDNRNYTLRDVYIVSLTSNGHMPDHATQVCDCLHRAPSTLLWARPPLSNPFRPRQSRSWNTIVISLLLLSANVEPNPGPPVTSSLQATNIVPDIKFGCLNVRSCRSKAALLHSIISDNSLDILALQETWLATEDPPAITRDIAPAGFTVLHVFRDTTRVDGPVSGGGLAVVARGGLRARPHPLASSFRPRHFELQLVRLGEDSCPIAVANVYRRPSSVGRPNPVPAFIEELSEVLASITAGVTNSLSVVTSTVLGRSEHQQSTRTSSPLSSPSGSINVSSRLPARTTSSTSSPMCRRRWSPV